MTVKIQLNETEAAERWGMSVHWFRRARFTGDGPPYVKMAGRCLYPVVSTDAFFESKIRSSTAGQAYAQKGGPGRGHHKKPELSAAA